MQRNLVTRSLRGLSPLVLAAIVGCSASTTNVGTLVLPTSNRTIDVVQHRSDSKGCAELVVLQTYSQVGTLIDSKEGRGQSLPCLLTGAIIESGSRVGSAALIANGLVNAAKATRPDSVNIDNANTQAQGQGQGQLQGQGQYQGSTNVNQNSNSAQGGQGGNGGNGGGGGGGGNGGNGNNGEGGHSGHSDNNSHGQGNH